ncbi:hypothetical protein ABZX93_35060 [Streptomyces sp. NPDC006632]|uniref:hypothetical protein n=1 Tax=Streptomyces sp. NPDC006632 TaxID=3157182 RepID=UPI0033B6C876
MPSSIPPLPGLTRYTRWDLVPDGLKTKTMLDQQGLKPGSDPVGQVLYHGNSYAPLYEESAAVPKRRVSPAQRAVLDRARELQYRCRRCGTEEREPLGKGRFCDPCRYAMTLWEQHDQAQLLARELVADPAAVLLVVDVAPDSLPEAQRVAVVGVRDHQVLYAAEAGQYGSPERGDLLDRLDALLEGRRVVEEPDFMGPHGRYPHALLRPPNAGPVTPGRDPLHPWAAPSSSANASVTRIWAGWFGWTDRHSSTTACAPWEWSGDLPMPWTRSLDLAADGLSMADVLHRIADGTEPVWERAAWTVDGYGVGLTEVSA